jgi:HTH-type transcriptional regulator/antitoxin HigA
METKHQKFLELVEAEENYLMSTSAETNTAFDGSIATLEWFENNKRNIPIPYLIDKNRVDPENQEFSAFSFYNRNAPKSQKFFKRTVRTTDNNVAKKEVLRATWIALVMEKAEHLILPNYKKLRDVGFLSEIARLSSNIENILSVFEVLREKGIGLVIERYIQGSEVDAVITMNESGNPIIGMSLRYDRIDNFWFSLTHELAHLIYHLSESDNLIIDDLNPANQTQADEIENEANYFARQAIIPSRIWNRSELKKFATKKGIYMLAEQLQIHPALVAGRVQWETRKFSLHRDIVDKFSVSGLLEEKLNEIL